MSRKSEYSIWKDRIKLAQEYKKKIVDPKMIQRFLDYYKNDFFKNQVQTDRISVNMVQPTVKILQAALALNIPSFKAIADNPSNKSREVFVESSLDTAFARMKFTNTNKKCVRDAHLNWGGVCKTGYNFKLAREILDKDIQEVSPDTRDPKEFAEHQIYHEFIKEDSVYAIRVSPGNLFICPDATENLTDAEWCFQQIIQPKEYVEEKFKVETSGIPDMVAEWLTDNLKKLGLGSTKDVSKAVVYEIYSLKEGKRIVMIEGYEKVFTYDWKAPFYPYSTLVFTENPDENYGTPDIKSYEAQQLELNMIRSLQMNTIKRNNPRWQMIKNTVDTEEVKKFEQNLSNSLITVQQENAIKPIAPVQIDPSLFNYEPHVRQDMQTITGTDEIMQGGQQATRKSATETAVRDFYAKLRITERKEIVDAFVTDVAEKVLWNMQENYDIPRFISIAGANAKFLFDHSKDEEFKKGLATQTQGNQNASFSGQYPITKEDLCGKFQIYVRTSSTAQNKQLDTQRIMSLLPFLSVNPLIYPNELTQLIVDVGLDGFDTSKLVIPNAYDMMQDPMKAEMFRQIMMGMGKIGGDGGIRTPTGAGSAGDAMTQAKMQSEGNQPQGPKMNTSGLPKSVQQNQGM